MKLIYLGLAVLLAGPALAQPGGVPKPVQTIALGEHETMGAALALPNHNTVLLRTSSVSDAVLAQCLAPDGHTLWQTTLSRYQHSIPNSDYLFDTRDIAIGKAARDRKQLAKEMEIAGLWPTNVFTEGNNVVLTESIDEATAKGSGKKGMPKLAAGQVFVQRLDAEGHLSKHLFDAPAEPESRKIELRTLGRYADAEGYVLVMRERNTREETTTFYLQHFDLATKTLRREPLVLPATPKQPNNMWLRHWYQEWSYLGHRPGQTYFSRRTLEGGPNKAKPGDLPVNFEVHVANDHGAAAAPAGFRTTLELPQGTRVAYSGRVPNPAEANHVPAYFSMARGRSYIEVDEYNATSGGMGGFFIDYATGDVLVYGEYGVGDNPLDGTMKLTGFFMRRYSAGGQVLAQMQQPYTPEMLSFGSKYQFKGNLERRTRFHADPVTGQYQFSTTYELPYANRDTYNFYFDHALAMQRYDHPYSKPKAEQGFIFVHYAQPFHTTTNFGANNDIRVYEHASQADVPLYASLEKLRHATPAEAENYWFYLVPAAPGKALVVEKPEGMGGKLNVYSF